MRARLITMPPATGSAPPLRPVPEPRATKGMPLAMADADHGLHLFGAGAAARTAAGTDAEVGQPVALVGPQLLRRGDQRIVADSGAQAGDLAITFSTPEQLTRSVYGFAAEFC